MVHPFLYDWEHPKSPGARLLVGHNAKGGNDDLPRNIPGRALIGDARNDENVIVAQIHLLFIQFHNAVLDGLGAAPEHWEDRFEKARKIVRWHYQWLVVHDFLPKILGDSQMASTAGSGGGAPISPPLAGTRPWRALRPGGILGRRISLRPQHGA